ncbi:MAG: VCBS repeat-containing protein [Planctomycetota bacterium]
MKHACLLVSLAPTLVAVSSASAAQQLEPVRDMLPRSAQVSRDLALDDLDGDGDLDAVAATFDGLLLYRNDGSAVFAREAVGPAAFGVGAADVDGDGDVDLYAALDTQDVLLRNDGTGAFAEDLAAIPSVFVSGGFVAFEDVDGDGDPDCLRSILGGAQVGLLVNDGSGTFADGSFGVQPLFGAEDVADAALGDLDGDGDVDAYVATLGLVDAVLLGDGAGAFSVSSGALPGTALLAADAVLADVDLDGDLDVALAALAERVLLNDGAAGFVDAALPASGSSAAVDAGDVDGDGDPDVLFGGLLTDRLYLSDGSGAFTAALLPQDPVPVAALRFGDLDGDDDLDLVLVGEGADRLLLGDGAGRFVQTEPSVSTVAAAVVVAGDLDGDGDLDALTGASAVRRLDNDGAGFLREVHGAVGAPTGSFGALALGDLDGDGDLDAWAGSSAGCQNEAFVLANDGAGLLTRMPDAVPAITGALRDVALADFDADGDLDVATASSSICVSDQAANQLLLNAGGAGVLVDASALLPPNGDRTQALVASDLDGDGDVDLLAGNDLPGIGGGGQQNRIYANDGSGAFVDATDALPAIEDNTSSLAVGDIDADGDLDVLVGNASPSFSAPCRLLRNDGAAFVDVPSAIPTAAGATALALADLDGDGDLDAYVASLAQDELWTNIGLGLFVAQAPGALLPAEDDFASDLVVADFDLDGDLDALVGGTLALNVNVARQLSWRGLPRAGKPLTLEVRGPGAGVFGLAYSVSPAQLPVPGLGALLIDPAALTVLVTGALDAAGAAEVRLAVPAGVAGVAVYWQALVGPDFGALRFTNRELTEATVY